MHIEGKNVCFYFYNSSSIRCYPSSLLFKEEYNTYLNLDCLDVNYAYSPVFYKTYQGIKDLQKIIHEKMKIEDYS